MSRSVPIRHDPFFEWKSPLQLLDSFGLKSRGDFHHEEDVHGFKENEIDVRVLGNKVSIHCLHEDANNRREINKSFYLPDDVDSATVRSHLSHSGSTLTVTAHKKEQSQSAFGAAHGGATRIPVQHEPKFGVGSLLSSHQRKNFEVDLDVHQFAPHEIQVKVSGNDVIIHCLHDGKDGGEVVKREINRTYRLPDDIDPYTVKSNLSNTGMLTITAQNKY